MKRVHRSLSILLMLLSSAAAFAERPVISHIRTDAGTANTITISWDLPHQPEPPITGLTLYRDTQPITSHLALDTLT
ncbi:MAG: hypothetical protein IJ191_03580, partial [Treponema sp.]|nr:hypothetical protein [Treponema sp.]